MKKVKIRNESSCLQDIAEIMPPEYNVNFGIMKHKNGTVAAKGLWLHPPEGDSIPLTTGYWFVVFQGSVFILSETEMTQEMKEIDYEKSKD